MKNFPLMLMISSAVIGLFDAGFITWQKINHAVPPCTVKFQCEIVLTSKWSNIGPVPISFLGILFYLSVLLLTISLYLQINLFKKAFDILTLVGVIFSAYLITVMGVILHAWCIYCLISALNCIFLFSVNYYSKRASST